MGLTMFFMLPMGHHFGILSIAGQDMFSRGHLVETIYPGRRTHK